MKKLITILFISNLIIFSASAAKVNCSFMSGITITKEGVWVSSENDFMKLFDMFGEEGLNLELENSLLAKLDTMQPFLAGETKLGKVYLTGSDMGVEGRNIKIEGNNINIYYGLCTVGFG
tara:strand:- start:254 stop:613 length:360 start_codon:yes stop_codon:yes gene_type:complete